MLLYISGDCLSLIQTPGYWSKAEHLDGTPCTPAEIAWLEDITKQNKVILRTFE